jgi:hypothetical protein
LIDSAIRAAQWDGDEGEAEEAPHAP